MVSKTSLKSPAASAVRCRISACSKLRARQCSSFECFRDERTASRENALTAMPLSNSPRTAAVNQARMRALLRGRALATASAVASTRRGVLAQADLRLDQDTREAWRGERRLELRHKGFELLAYLMRHPGRVLSRRQLLEQVWGYEYLGESNVIDVTISHVRQALEADGEPRLIHTVRPLGYILKVRG